MYEVNGKVLNYTFKVSIEYILLKDAVNQDKICNSKRSSFVTFLVSLSLLYCSLFMKNFLSSTLYLYEPETSWLN